jgi:hypothetical protein
MVANSKAYKWNVQVTANRDELKVITTNIINIFIQNAEACYNSSFAAVVRVLIPWRSS